MQSAHVLNLVQKFNRHLSNMSKLFKSQMHERPTYETLTKETTLEQNSTPKQVGHRLTANTTTYTAP